MVPAATPAGDVGHSLVPATAPGLDRQRQDTTTGTPEALLVLDGVAVGAGGAGSARRRRDHLAWLVEHATVALCAVTAGACAEAVRLTGEYTTGREQFGRPIATFQAVGQRAADAYVGPGGAAHHAPGCLAAVGRDAGRPGWPWPSTGRRPAASGWCTPRRTCTAA